MTDQEIPADLVELANRVASNRRSRRVEFPKTKNPATAGIEPYVSVTEGPNGAVRDIVGALSANADTPRVRKKPGRPAVEYPTNTLSPHALAYIGERRRRGEIEAATVRNFRNHLLKFSASYGRRPLAQLGPAALERFVEEMTAEGLALSTQRLRMSTIKNFAHWCVVKKVTRTDWSIGAPKIKRYRQTPRDMTNDHAAAVLAEARDGRERLLVLLMFGCGLRCIEVHRLNVNDFELNPAQLFVKGKGGHERYVPAPAVVERAIEDYLASAGHRHGPLIRTADGSRRLGWERISGIVNFLVRESGVKVRRFDGRSAHGLRAAAASDLYEACGDALTVQAFLGHQNLQTTSIYLRRAGVERVREAQAQRPLSTG